MIRVSGCPDSNVEGVIQYQYELPIGVKLLRNNQLGIDDRLAEILLRRV